MNKNKNSDPKTSTDQRGCCQYVCRQYSTDP